MSVLTNLGTPRRVLGKKKGLHQKCPVAEKSLISTPAPRVMNKNIGGGHFVPPPPARIGLRFPFSFRKSEP